MKKNEKGFQNVNNETRRIGNEIVYKITAALIALFWT